MKNPGVNIVFFVFTSVLFLIISCAGPVKAPLKGELIKADSEFSALSVKEGMYRAFLEYAADSGLLFRDGAYPLEGREQMAALFSGGSDTSFTLEWEPQYEIIAASGELGYTWGYWTRTIRSTGEKGRGTYITVWKKQSDGSWKFVADVGTDQLPEKSK